MPAPNGFTIRLMTEAKRIIDGDNLEDLVDAGRIRALGVSNFDVADLDGNMIYFGMAVKKS